MRRAVALALAVAVLAAACAGPGSGPDRTVANLAAYARLLNHVRFVHPSDAAASTDWLGFVAATADDVGEARSPAELAARLEAAFEPVAPTVRVAVAGEAPGLPPQPAAGDVVWWDHYGLGTADVLPVGGTLVYRSELRRSGGSGAPDPADAPVVRLGDEVVASIPAALPAQDARSDGLRPEAEPPGLAWRDATYDDRSTRIAAVALLWGAIEHFSPHRDPARWDAALDQALAAAVAPPGPAGFAAVLRRMLASADDGHALITDLDRGEDRSVPPLLWDWVEGRLVVTYVASDDLGVEVGDEVVAVDGVAAAAALEGASSSVSGATAAHRRLLALDDLLAGDYGTDLELQLHRVADRVTVRRTTALPAHLREPRPQPVAEFERGAWYVDLTRVTNRELTAALPDLIAATAIVFDARGRPLPGLAPLPHLLDEPVPIVHGAVPRIVAGRRTMESIDAELLRPAAPRLTARVAFLADARALSYAETYLAIVADHGLGVIVGAPTAGTNGNVNLVALPGGLAAYFTGMEVVRANGSPHHGVGVEPDVAVGRTVAGVRDGRDEVLDAALVWLLGA